jgi:hypothetical protein
MTAIQKISQEAKRIYKANPELTWRECIKKASLLYTKKKKNAIVKKVKSIPTKAKKVAVKKAKAGAKSIIKKLYESKILNGTKAVAKKKAVKKSPARSMHKDTKSHNVNIRVMSGLRKIIGMPHKSKYYIDYKKNGILIYEYFDKLPKDKYKGMDGTYYLTRLTDYGTSLIPLINSKTNKSVKK